MVVTTGFRRSSICRWFSAGKFKYVGLELNHPLLIFLKSSPGFSGAPWQLARSIKTPYPDLIRFSKTCFRLTVQKAIFPRKYWVNQGINSAAGDLSGALIQTQP